MSWAAISRYFSTPENHFDGDPSRVSPGEFAAAVGAIAGEDDTLVALARGGAAYSRLSDITREGILNAPQVSTKDLAQLARDRQGGASLIQRVKGARLDEALVSPPKATAFSAFAPLQAAPRLERPVVFFPGLTLDASSWSRATRHLAATPGNGDVLVFAGGAFHLGSKTGPVASDELVQRSKIFVIEHQDAKATSEAKRGGITEMLRTIGGTVDVVTHSAGGHDLRNYLERRDADDRARVKIGKVVMVGPVTHGTFMGNVGGVVGGLAGVQAAAKDLAIGSAFVETMDARWPEHREQIGGAVTIIGIEGTPTVGPATPSGEIFAGNDGDGFVRSGAIGLDGARVVTVRGMDPTPLAHLCQVRYGGVINEITKALR